MGALLALLGVAAAQARPIVRTPKGAPDFSPSEARRELATFADCTATSEPIAMRRLLASRPRSAQEQSVLHSFGDNTNICMKHGGLWGSQLRANAAIMRGALFTSLYRRRFGEIEAPSFAAGLPTPKADRSSVSPDVADEFDYLYAVAGCTIRQKPAEARALILTLAETPEEKTALEAVMPAIANCLPSDRKLALSRPLLRGVMAETLYDWSASSRPDGSNR